MTQAARLPEDGAGRKGMARERVVTSLPEAAWHKAKTIALRQHTQPTVVFATLFAILVNRLAGEPICFVLINPNRPAGGIPVCLDAAAETGPFADAPRHLVAADPEPTPYAFTVGKTDDTSQRTDWTLLAAVEPPTGGQPAKLAITFDPAAFSAARTRGFADGYRHLLDAAFVTPDAKVADLPVAATFDRARSWPSAASALTDNPADLHALFQTAVRRWPHAPAVIWPQGRLTFLQLAQAADTLATLLRTRGITPGDLIAVRVTADAPPASSVLYLCAHIATLGLGCGVMPLGQQVSSTQAKAQIERVGARFLLSAAPVPDCDPDWLPAAQSDNVPGFPQATLFTRNGEAGRFADPDKRPAVVLTSSGTTGTPKTVLLSQAMILEFLRGLDATNTFAPVPALMNPNIGFDIVLADIWMPWIHGHHVVVLETERRTPAVLATARTLGAGFTSFSPSLAAVLLDQDPDCLRDFAGLHVAGEMLPLPLARRLHAAAPDTRIVNGYGPSECAPLSTVWPVEPDNEDRVPIGYALPGYRVLVADDQRRPLPPHWPGEYLIASAAPALGYFDQAMTHAAFSELPGEAPGPFFQSGDFGWIDSQGRAQFIGRKDRQLKLHGIRVELDGIEHRVTEVDGVADAAVVPVAAAGQPPALIAVVQPAADVTDQTALASRIRTHCRDWLPRTALPAEVVFVDTLPYGPSGKKAYRQLTADLERRNETPVCNDVQRTKPADNSVEARLAAIWRKILAFRPGTIDDLCVEDDVFAAGATSLDALSAVETIGQHFGIRVPNHLIFIRPTIAEQAATIRDARQAAPSIVRQRCTLTRIRPASNDSPSKGIVLGMPGIQGSASYLGVVAKHTLKEFDLWSAEVDLGSGTLLEGRAWLDTAELIRDKLTEPDAPRPRVMLGYSLGGFIAWLVDRLLVTADHAGTPTINLDGRPPDQDLPGWRESVMGWLPDRTSPAARMLLLLRDHTGRIPITQPLDKAWTNLGVAVETRLIATVSHHDFNREAVLRAEDEALTTYAEMGTCGLQDPHATQPIDSPGSALFQHLKQPDRVTAADMRAFLSSLPPGPIENELRLGLVFLTLLTGDADLALSVTDRLLAEAPHLTDHVYARLAALSETGCFAEARQLADRWLADHPNDRPMTDRATRRHLAGSAATTGWSQATGLYTGQSFNALDFAAARLGRVEVSL